MAVSNIPMTIFGRCSHHEIQLVSLVPTSTRIALLEPSIIGVVLDWPSVVSSIATSPIFGRSMLAWQLT
jgi:hypothetical protein